MNYVIYDCEIVRGIPPRGGERLEGVEYCDGWTDYAGMGVSVVGAFDYRSERYRVFCEDNFGEMMDCLSGADLLVSFNGVGFDDNLLAATVSGFSALRDIPRYDLLSEIWRAAGLKPSWGSPATHGGYGLNAMCRANFVGLEKTGHGAQAPVDWQRGRIGTVIDYCLSDIYLTMRLFDMALSGEAVADPKRDRQWLRLRDPSSLTTRTLVRQPDPPPRPTCSECGVRKPYHRTDCSAIADPNEEIEEARAINATVDALLLDWDDCAVSFARRVDADAYDVELRRQDDLIVLTSLSLSEWSGYAVPLINAKDAPGLAKYLIKMVRVGGRDGKVIGE